MSRGGGYTQKKEYSLASAVNMRGLVEEREGLVEVYDVDPGPLGEDVALHLGVPALGLVSEVDPGLEQLSYSYAFGCALQDIYLSL